jgi:hypothetical protein
MPPDSHFVGNVQRSQMEVNMPSWIDDFKQAVKTLADQVSAHITAPNLDDLVNKLTGFILGNDFASAAGPLAELDRFFNRTDLAKLVIMKALLQPGADRVTVEAVIRFIRSVNLVPNGTIVGVLFPATGSPLPQQLQKSALEVLANRWMNLDNLLAVIDRAGLGPVCLPLLVQINYQDGQSTLYGRLLKYGRRFPALFPLIVSTLLAPGSGLGITPEDLLIWSLEFEKRYRDQVVPMLLGLLFASGLDIPKALRQAWEHGAYLLKILVAFLFAVPAIAGWNAPFLTRLLEAPGTAYRGNLNGTQDLFAAVFQAVTDYAQANKHLDLLMTWVVDWLRPNTGADIPLTKGLSFGISVQVPGLAVSTPVWLVGNALQKLLGNHALLPGFAQELLAAFVAPIVILADSNARDALLAQLFAIRGMGVLLIPALVFQAIQTHMHIWDWLGQDVRGVTQSDRALRIKELKPPSEVTHRKYMIFSDLHRDAPEDVVDPIFFDVSHFTKNKDVYKNALIYCRDHGYTVIENGDCEELWYQPRLRDEDPGQRAQSILTAHDDVYQILRTLYDDDGERNRYFRIRGNHDDYWVNGGDMTPLRQRFSANFTIWDALVIPDVKTMESEIFQVIRDLARDWDKLTDEQIMDRLLTQVPLGLSPDRYHKKKPLFILHGHQMDFWNCDEHNYLGKAITRGIAVPADGIDAFPYYLKGIDWDGNPLIKFWDILAKITPWENWPPEDFALDATRQIENMSEFDRKLQDSLSFSETFAALVPYLMRYDSRGPSLLDPAVQILIGHTHYPQSRPHLNLQGLFGIGGLIDRLVKVPYYNSGGGGWWEGIVWAIEITEKGQPTLVYWERNSFGPRPMSWELHAPDIDLTQFIPQIKDFLTEQSAWAASAIRRLLQSIAGGLKALATFQDLENQLAACQGQPLSLNLGGLSPVGQYKSVSLALFALLRTPAVGTAGSPARIEISLPIGAIPILEGSFGVIKRVGTPTYKLKRILGDWLHFLQVGAALQTPDMDLLAGLFFACAVMFGSGIFNLLGLLVMAAGHQGAVQLQTQYNAAAGKLGIVLLPK